MNTEITNAFVILAIVGVLGAVVASVIRDDGSKKEWNQQFKDRACSVEYRVGQGKNGPYQYGVWKCPNDTNEYLVK